MLSWCVSNSRMRPKCIDCQHTDQLLREIIGCSETEIRRLRGTAIVE